MNVLQEWFHEVVKICPPWVVVCSLCLIISHFPIEYVGGPEQTRVVFTWKSCNYDIILLHAVDYKYMILEMKTI